MLGIDLGTSSVKVVVFTVEGAVKGIGVAEYPPTWICVTESLFRPGAPISLRRPSEMDL
jgi:hypothetical protein